VAHRARPLAKVDHPGEPVPREDGRERFMTKTARDLPRRAGRTPVYACSGDTRLALLARELADRLAASPGQAAWRVPAVAIDGCESACVSRKLEAAGVSAAVVGLHELGVGAADVPEEAAAHDALLAELHERLARKPARAARRRRTPPPGRLERRHGKHSIDDYLHALYALGSPVVACGAVASGVPTIAAHVAEALSVSRPSAGEMLARLGRAGYVEHGGRKEILLTPAGRLAAERVVRRQRVAERFLTDMLGYSAAESHDLAVGIRRGFDDAMVERVADVLTAPAECPHGWPLDPARDREHAANLVSLAARPPGSRVRVAALAESEAAGLGRLERLGIELGAEVAVLERRPDALDVAVGAVRRRVDVVDAALALTRACETDTGHRPLPCRRED
jgi:DtxR family Mn-dependent transcriptional regulator